MKLFAFLWSTLFVFLFARTIHVDAASLIVNTDTHAQVALNSLQFCTSGLTSLIFDLGRYGTTKLAAEGVPRVLAAKIASAESQVKMLVGIVNHLGPMGTENYVRHSPTAISSVLRGAENLSIALRQIHGKLQKAGDTQPILDALLKLKIATDNYLGALMVYLRTDVAAAERARSRLNTSMEAVIQIYSS